MAVEIEKQIIDAVTALNLFVKARYIYAESDSDEVPTLLPVFILSDGGKDFSVGQTFCGIDPDFYIQRFNATIIAESAAEVRSLSRSVIGALSTLVNVTDTVDTFDDELSAFVSELTFVS